MIYVFIDSLPFSCLLDLYPVRSSFALRALFFCSSLHLFLSFPPFSIHHLPTHREYAGTKKKKFKPVIISHHMLSGLKEGQEKMSKSDPDSAIFMEGVILM